MNGNKLNENMEEISKMIFSYCRAKTSSREDAEDLAQDIILELIKSSDSLRSDDAFYGFMWAVAGNVYKQWYRKKLKTVTCELTEDIPEDDSECESTDDIYLLRRELALLSEKYRRATVMYYIYGLSCSEISSRLSTSESMVKYLLFKSRKILKEGMNMERNLGELSYNPKNLIPMYSGEGPNRFYSFMNNLMRQNIVLSCYNDSLTAEQISLETGIPLPYLDDEVRELTEKKILVHDGRRYSANVVIINRECTEEICRKVSGKYDAIAKLIIEFVDSCMEEYVKLGFYGADFSENTLRWQLSTIMWRMIRGYAFKNVGNPEKTGWGEHADIWLKEDSGDMTAPTFNYCTVESKDGDTVWFFDYLPAPKGDHYDFYGNRRKIDLLCDIADGTADNLSEYDLETIAEMVHDGYVISENGGFRVAMPIYSKAQYSELMAKAEQFMKNRMGELIETIDNVSEHVIGEHTPSRLKESVARISGQDRFYHTVCAPAKKMLDMKYLSTSYDPLEMPTTYIVLNK